MQKFEANFVNFETLFCTGEPEQCMSVIDLKILRVLGFSNK